MRSGSAVPWPGKRSAARPREEKVPYYETKVLTFRSSCRNKHHRENKQPPSGFPCTKSYNNRALFPLPADAAHKTLSKANIRGLRGRDGAVARAIQRAGLYQRGESAAKLLAQPHLVIMHELENFDRTLRVADLVLLDKFPPCRFRGRHRLEYLGEKGAVHLAALCGGRIGKTNVHVPVLERTIHGFLSDENDELAPPFLQPLREFADACAEAAGKRGPLVGPDSGGGHDASGCPPLDKEAEDTMREVGLTYAFSDFLC